MKWVTTSWADGINVLSDVITVCPRSKDPFYVVTYYIKLVTTS